MPRHFSIGTALSTALALSYRPPGLRLCTPRGRVGTQLSAGTQPKKSYRLAPNVDSAWATFIHLWLKGGPKPSPTFQPVLPRTLKLSSGRRPATRPPPMVLRPGSAPLARPQSDFVTSDRVLTQPGRSPHPLRWALWGDGPPKCPSRRPPGRQRS